MDGTVRDAKPIERENQERRTKGIFAWGEGVALEGAALGIFG